MTKISNQYSLTNILTADLANSRLGINNVSPTVALDVTGAGKFSGVLTLASTISNGTYAYTLPSATGTLALTSALSGTTNYVAKFTGTSTIGNSLVYDNGTSVVIGTATPATNYILTLRTQSADYTKVLDWGTAAGGSWGNMTINTSAPYQTILNSGAWQFNISGTQKMLLDASGNVGIGTTSPTQLLHTYISTGSIRTLTETGNTSSSAFTAKNSTQATDYGTDSTGGFIQTQGAYPLLIYTNSTERMRITSAGNVGVGTASPSTKLHIYEASTSSTAYLTIQNNRARNAAIYTVTSNGGFYAGTSIGTDTFNYQIYDAVAGAARLTIASTGAATFSSSVTATSASALFKEGYIIQATTTSGGGSQPAYTYYTAAGSKRWSHFLDVGSDKFNIANSSNAEVFTITQAGNVGIGTTSPTDLLSLSGSQIGLSINSQTTGDAYIRFRIDGTVKTDMYVDRATDNFLIGPSVSSALIFKTNATERMRITSGGSVLIGTDSTAAGYKLHLVQAGSSAFIGVSNQGASNGDRQLRIGFSGTNSFAQIQGTRNGVADDINLALNPDGAANVLIGTSTNNGEKLYVSGSIRATGSITANSDISLKKNLLKIENALEKVEQINGYTYEFKEDDSKRHAGLIAQEVEIVLPEIVNAGNDKIKGIEYGNISALLVEAIKELSAEINLLKNK